MLEQSFKPDENLLDNVLATERNKAYKYGARTVFGKAQPLEAEDQLKLF